MQNRHSSEAAIFPATFIGRLNGSIELINHNVT